MIQTQRRAFSMLTAIVVIVTMSVLASYVLSTAGQTIKATTDQYRKEQAMFLAKSYTEYAIMAVSANNGRFNAGGCVNQIITTYNGGIGNAANPNIGYDIRLHISYIGYNDPLNAANNSGINNCPAVRQFSAAVQDSQTPLTLIIDTYIDYRDLNSRDTVNNQNMNQVLTYHRRSLQKI